LIHPKDFTNLNEQKCQQSPRPLYSKSSFGYLIGIFYLANKLLRLPQINKINEPSMKITFNSNLHQK